MLKVVLNTNVLVSALLKDKSLPAFYFGPYQTKESCFVFDEGLLAIPGIFPLRNFTLPKL